jgi:hypothetical protein
VSAYPGCELHVILDNLNTHKKNEHWLKKHPNVQFHFTPTRGSWLNQVEIWFSILQSQSLSGASFAAVKECRSTSMRSSVSTMTKPSRSSGQRKRSDSTDSKADVSLSSDSGY